MSRKPPQPMEELSDEFFITIGQCITEWARLDDKIFSAFRHCVGPLKQCAIIYYRMPGLDLRIGLTDEIIQSVLPKPAKKSGGHHDPLVKEWCAIANDARDLLSVRRRIAHQPVMVQSKITRSALYNTAPYGTVGYNSIAGEIESWFAIYTSQHERLREKESNNPSLTIDDLRKHLSALGSLVIRTHKFTEKLTARLAAEHPPQASEQRTAK